MPIMYLSSSNEGDMINTDNILYCSIEASRVAAGNKWITTFNLVFMLASKSESSNCKTIRFSSYEEAKNAQNLFVERAALIGTYFLGFEGFIHIFNPDNISGIEEIVDFELKNRKLNTSERDYWYKVSFIDDTSVTSRRFDTKQELLVNISQSVSALESLPAPSATLELPVDAVAIFESALT